jgi:uncharacterized protein YeaC (DUF1315 family)
MTLKEAQAIYPIGSDIWIDDKQLAHVVGLGRWPDGTITLSAVSYPNTVEYFEVVIWPTDNLRVKVPLSAA